MKKENEIIGMIEEAIAKKSDELKEYTIILFGSRATGEAGERSDFDIGIIGEKSIPPKLFFDLETLFEQIPTLYSIQLVDLHSVPRQFRDEALRKYRVLHGKAPVTTF